MIATCPECAARYRVDESKVGPRGARIRCAQCSEIFRVAGSEASAPASGTGDPATGASTSATAEGSAGRVVVAAGSGNSAAEIVTRLQGWGVEAFGVSDGAEAMLAIQRNLPRCVILDAALPGMNGRQICEFLKRNESLAEIKVLLVSADEDTRASASLFEYAPDANLQWADVPESLRDVMEGFGIPLAPEPAATTFTGPGPSLSAPPPASVSSSAPAPSSPPSSAPPSPPSSAPPSPPSSAPPSAPPAADGLDDERARAERLARIVVSDIVLYHQDVFARASREGTLVEDFRVDLDEGRRLLSERVDDRVSKERDYLLEELLRVAEERREG